MLNDLLTEQTIKLHQTADTWQEAITKAAQPLLDQNAIKPSYVEAMIQSVHQNGPYIVIALTSGHPTCKARGWREQIEHDAHVLQTAHFVFKGWKKSRCGLSLC